MTRLSQRGRRMPVLCAEEGVFQVTATSDLSLSRGQGGVIPETLKVSMPVPSSPWGPPKNEDSSCSRERIEAPLPPLQPRPTCERLELLFSCDAILSGYEDLVSSRSDQFTMWGKMSHQEFWLNTWLTFTELLPTSVMILNAFSHPLLSPVVSTNTFSSQLLCRRGSAFTTGTMGPDDQRKMLSKIKLQESGISLPCKKSFWVCRTRNPSWTISRDPLCGLCDSFQQGHLLPWHQRQIDLPSRHEARCARSNCWRRTWMGFTRCSCTCLFSSCCSQWSGLHRTIAAHQQYLCREKCIAKNIIQTIRAFMISQN